MEEVTIVEISAVQLRLLVVLVCSVAIPLLYWRFTAALSAGQSNRVGYTLIAVAWLSGLLAVSAVGDANPMYRSAFNGLAFGLAVAVTVPALLQWRRARAGESGQRSNSSG